MQKIISKNFIKIKNKFKNKEQYSVQQKNKQLLEEDQFQIEKMNLLKRDHHSENFLPLILKMLT
jgi:hypothetical protein